MAGTGLLALLDDITMILDDVAAMSKIAAQKTAGLAGDDLAVNAEAMVGMRPSRELPIIGQVAAASLANKAVLVPLALALPTSAITPLLMFGGTFLCYEGMHKITHRKDADDEKRKAEIRKALKAGPEALKAIERKKVKQAMVTDLVLSAEIVAVALAAVSDAPFMTRAISLAVVSVGMTLGIYGLVAVLVKLDDVGLHLKDTGAEGSLKSRAGELLVDYTPLLMRGISIIGTLAMFLVGGGIIMHGFPFLEHAVEDALHLLDHLTVLQSVLATAATLVVGLTVGLVANLVVGGVKKVLGKGEPGVSGAH